VVHVQNALLADTVGRFCMYVGEVDMIRRNRTNQ